MEGLLLVMWLAISWIGKEKAKRTMGAPKGWKRAAEWILTAQWEGKMLQDWKEAVSQCTGVKESTNDEASWEADAEE